MKRIIAFISILSISLTVFGINPDTVYRYRPEQYGLIFKEFKVKTEDNFLINVWFYPVQEAIPEDSILSHYWTNPIKKPYIAKQWNTPTIIICDGDAGNMGASISLALFLTKAGFNVVTFDWRGFGKSQAWNYGENIVEPFFLTDYNAVLDTILTFPEVNTSQIGAYSVSTGSYITMLQCAKRKEIKAVVLRGTFTNYQEATTVLNNNIYHNPQLLLYHPLFDTPEYDVWDLAPSITKPVFFIVGEHDIRTPPEMSIRLMGRINSNVRQLWIVEGAEHGGYLAPEIVKWEEFQERFITFFRQNLQE